MAQVVPLNATAPVNGELRGPDSQAVVTAVSWPYEADGYVANTGNRLVAFTVQLTEPTADVSAFGASTGPTLLLVVQGSPQSLDEADISDQVANSQGNTGTGTESYVASVPDDTHAVDLSMTDSGYTQTLSLWTLERTTKAPAVLYEDPVNSSVTEQIGITKTATITDPAFGTNVAEIFVSSAMLSAFDPDGSATPAPNSSAYLVLSMTANSTQSELYASDYLTQITPLPAGAVTFTSRTGRRYVSTRDLTGAASSSSSGSDDGMLDAVYSFLVPADTTGGVVSIAPAETSGYTYDETVQETGPDTMEVSGPIRFSVAFPTPPAVLGQPKPPWVDAPVPPTGLPAPTSGGSGGFPIWVALLLVVTLAATAAAARRRIAPRVANPEAPPTPSVTSREADPTDLLRVDFLGPVRVGPTARPLTEFGRAFVCFLAVHGDRPRSVDDTQTALWASVGTAGDVSRKTFLNYVSDARRALGTRHLPENVQRSGYRLVDFVTDWNDFRQLEATARRSTGDERHRARVAALELVRGVPFESELTRWFQWTDTEGLRTVITKSVIRVAAEAHADRVQAGDLVGAEWAIRQGLRCNPFELTLWGYLADVVQAKGDPGDLERFWRDAAASLDGGSVSTLRERVHG